MADRARRAAVLALALFLVWAPAPAAAQVADAIAEWCEVDPPLMVRTPAGRLVVLHVTNYGLGREHLRAVQRATISATTSPARGAPAGAPRAGAFLVQVVVEVPLGTGGKRFPTKSVVSTLPFVKGTVLAEVTGQSGSPMLMDFWLDEP